MPRYYGHKPSWRGSNTGSGASNAPRSSPVLETTRSPSGGYVFSGEVYSPPANSGGPRTSVPRSAHNAGALSPAAAKGLKQRQRLLGLSAKLNMAAAFADPATLQGAMDYGWDDFMEGRLPPPFDWLNAEIPPSMMPTKGGAPDTVIDPVINGTVAWNGGFVSVGKPTNLPGGARTRVSVVQAVPLPSYTLRPTGTAPGPHTFFEVPPANMPTVQSWSANLGQAAPWSGIAGNAPIWIGAWQYTSFTLNLTTLQPIVPNRMRGVFYMETVFPRAVGETAPNLKVVAGPVGLGATAPASLVVRGTLVNTWAALPARSPAPVPNYLVGTRNLLGQILGTQINTPGDPDYDLALEQGTKTIIPPKGPVITVPTKPGEPPHPPGNGTKERKARLGGKLMKVTHELFHSITEYGDVIDALFEAIPKKNRCKTKSLVGKSLCVAQHWYQIDIGDAIVNLAWNKFEDDVIGKQLFARNQNAAAARGDPYGFRTLNSINGYGGLDALGELYGGFSQDYVTPSKNALKAYLSKHYGI